MARRKKSQGQGTRPVGERIEADAAGQPAGAGQPSARWKWIVSVLLLLHLTAVFAAPMHFASTMTGSASPATERVLRVFEPYLEAFYLRHGYAFFAPDPGASHLLRYQVERSDGARVGGVLPDRERHWPRLRYHRHFMLSEQLTTAYVPPQPPPELLDEPELYARWQSGRQRYERLWASYERHLLKRYGGERVDMVRVEHRPPMYFEFLEGMELDDPRLYRDLLEDDDPWDDVRGVVPGIGPLRGHPPAVGEGVRP